MIVDLRSDTFTKPSKDMRRAIARAEVGDDVFGEDPTVNRLQEEVASLLGKERGLFVASGTMANQIAVNAHTQPGEEVILEANSHIFYYEAGGAALLSGVQLRPISTEDGILRSDQIENGVRPENVHFPPTSLICLENTLNRAGGKVFPIDEIKRIREVADKYNLKLHLDGARLWNASVATGIPLDEYAKYFDSVSVCFSKGLGAPVGSLLAGSEEFINRAHRYRKIYGGGMRQAGIIAAGALYAVRNNVRRLAEDHENARTLAEGVASLPGISIDMDSVQTNIIIMKIERAKYNSIRIVEALKKRGVLILAVGPDTLRAVTHLDVSKKEIKYAVRAFQEVFRD